MSKVRQPFVQTRRDAWVEINLSNIEHNIKELYKFIKPETKFLAVVKADAYGHGATMIAPTLLASGVNMLGVASVDEGMQLRDSGINAPIIVLGSAPGWTFVSAVENDIELSIFTDEHLKACINTFNRLNKMPKVHIKIDTGMNRIGISHDKACDFINKVKNTEEVDLKSIFTHLACAEDGQETNEQNNKFKNLLNQIKLESTESPIIHIVNTSGIIGYSDMHYDMVRAGIGIYGLNPDFHSGVQEMPDLKQAMSLKGRIVHIHDMKENDGISYGFSYKATKDTRVATIPIGYADGLTRTLSNKIFGLINGFKVPQIGNITMDQVMFDVTGLPNVSSGDVITLLGEDHDQVIRIDEWATLLNTINYEITCRLRVRLPRVYTR